MSFNTSDSKSSAGSADNQTSVTLLFQDLYPEASSWIDEVRKGLEDHEPEMVENGEGGTYFLKDTKGNSIAIFKPVDEEPFSVSNPKLADREVPEANRNSDIKQGILPGEGAYREVAAYLLDNQHFAKVPTTVFVEFTYPLFNWKEKQGSLQRFVQHDCESWDIGPSEFNVSDIHKIGILDLRLFNVDRHGGNILAKRLDIVDRGSYELIPIDHGFSLPDSVNGTDLWFEWLLWSQSSKPFSEEELAYISKLNVSNDAHILRKLGIREECVKTMMISTTLLKLGAARRLTLAQIAGLLCRTRHYLKKKSITKSSPIEAMANNLPVTHSKYFLVWLESEIEKVLDTHFPKPAPPKEDNKLFHRRLQQYYQTRAQQMNQKPGSTSGTFNYNTSSSPGTLQPQASLSSSSVVVSSSSMPTTTSAPRTHMRSNSNILDAVPEATLTFMRRTWSHEGLAILNA